LIFLDLETTGITPEDRICSVGVIKDDVTMYELYNENRKITPKASSIHHITNEMIVSKPSFRDGEIFHFLEQKNTKETILVVHNWDFVGAMLELSGFHFIGKVIDTKRVAKHLISECESYALQFLRYECRLYQEEEYALTCNALDDAYVISLLYRYFLELVSVEKMIDLTQTPVLLEKFLFGKYKQKYIEEIAMCDRNYLVWLLTLEDIDEDLRYSLEYYIKG